MAEKSCEVDIADSETRSYVAETSGRGAEDSGCSSSSEKNLSSKFLPGLLETGTWVLNEYGGYLYLIGDFSTVQRGTRRRVVYGDALCHGNCD